jgi:hypothetical protein
MEGAPVPGTLRERRSFRGWDVRVEGSVDGRRAPEMEHLSLGELCWENLEA